MSNILKLEFCALDVLGNNSLSCALDIEIYLHSKGLSNTIEEGNSATLKSRAIVLIFLCHHIFEELKLEYLTIKDLKILWTCLKDRYDHLKLVVEPMARNNWVNLHWLRRDRALAIPQNCC